VAAFEHIHMPPLTDRGHCRTQSQCKTNESLAPLALQKWKLEKAELRLRGEIRLFQPENP
jgi:hypothetical protein